MRIILVREWDSQHTGSGCCGTIGGIHDELGGGSDYAHCRVLMDRMGAVYRALRAALGAAVAIEVVDPRNTFWLLPALWRDARRRGATWAEAWRTVRQGTANGAIVADGRVLSVGPPPDPAAVVTKVEGLLRAG
ncbi:hypothetical protein [Euzebya sp.]|uniref:hypothetical protein n=1 Tax=Euzebya sp. TaxID=1971409 RepID=UPI003512767B